MTEPVEMEPRPAPTEAFGAAVHQRHAELNYLVESLTACLEVVSDLHEVNRRLEVSPRPDLAMTRAVPQMELTWPFQRRQLNNFIPNMTSLGPRVYRMQKEWSGGKEELTCVGRRLPTAEERDFYFTLGARGTMDDYFSFAEANGMDRNEITDLIMTTPLKYPAFMRMWILFPDLTDYLMTKCLEEPDVDKSIDEELFVAYSVMSKLVDINDPHVRRSDRSLDDWRLCR